MRRKMEWKIALIAMLPFLPGANAQSFRDMYTRDIKRRDKSARYTDTQID